MICDFADILQDIIDFTLARASSTREELLIPLTHVFKPRELEEEVVAIVQEPFPAVDDSLDNMSKRVFLLSARRSTLTTFIVTPQIK